MKRGLRRAGTVGMIGASPARYEPRSFRRGAVLCAFILATAVCAGTAAGQVEWKAAGPLMDFAYDMAFDPGDARAMYACDASRRLYRSGDAGESWDPIYTCGEGYLHVLAVSPSFASDRTIYAAVGGHGVSVSANAGRSWAPAGGAFGGNEVMALELSPAFATDRTILAGTWTEGGIFRSLDGGASWHGVNGGLDSSAARWIDSLAFSPAFSSDATVIAGTRAGPYKSVNGGASWSPSNAGCVNRNIYALAISPSFDKDRTVFAGTDAGVYRSADGGASWQAVNDGIAELNLWQGGVAISPDFARDRTVLAGSYQGTVYRSTDGGDHWAAVGPPGLGMIVRVAFSPWYAFDRAIYVSAASSNIWKSTDGGEHWHEVASGLGGCWSAFVEVSPGYAGDGELFLGTLAGIVKSADRGATWRKINAGLTNLSVLSLAPSPAYAGDGTLFAGTRRGIFRSTDRGGRWTDIGAGLPAVNDIFSIAVSPAFASDATLFATVYRQGVFRSGDGGATWEGRNTGLATLGVMHLALSPGFPADGVIFAGTNRGVFRSDDAGGRWAAAGELRGNVTSLSVSPRYAEDRTVFAGIHQGGLYRSADGGGSWERIEGGLPSANVNAVRYAGGASIFAATAAGVYRSLDGGATWALDTSGFALPNESSSAIAVSPSYGDDGTLFAATAGNVYRGMDRAVAPYEPTPTPVASPTAPPSPTPAPPTPAAPARSLELALSPASVGPGGRITLSWRCVFDRWDYRDRPVDVYLAVLKDPAGDGSSCRVSDALASGAVWFFAPGLAGLSGAAWGPAFSGVVFSDSFRAGELRFAVPAAEGGGYAFAAAIVDGGTGEFVRTDGTPVEVSNRITVD